MGSRNKVLLASLVSMVMMLSFAIGLVPSTVDSSITGASAAAPVVAITADGATPAGDSLTLSVGESVSFSALGANAAVNWSLASNGSAELVDDGDGVTVVALAPGESGLYLSSADGADLVNVTVVDAAEDKALETVRILTPANGSRVFVQAGASNVPYAVTSATNDASDTGVVEYTLNDSPLGASISPPYAVNIPDITDFVTGASATNTLVAAATTYAAYAGDKDTVTGTSNFSVIQGNFDDDGNGLPDNPFSLDLGPGDSWVGTRDGTSRQVVIVPLADNFNKLVEFNDDGATASVTSQTNPAQVVSAFAPAGLLAEDEIGYLVLVVADTLDDLLDAGADGDILDFPGDGLVAGARFAEVSIIVSSDGGNSFAEIASPLAGNVQIQMEGVATVAGDEVRAFSYGSTITQPPVLVEAFPTGDWTTVATLVENGVVSASTNALSVFAPFSTPGAANITSVINTTSGSSLLGSSQARATGGDDLIISVDNVDPADSVTLTIDGFAVTPDNATATATGTNYEVTAPTAVNVSGAPIESLSVDVAIDVAGDVDIAASALTFVGPTVDDITPASGTAGGGTAVAISGEALTGASVTIGGNPLVNPTVTDTTISGTTPAGDAGTADVVVAYSNNFVGVLADGFVYIPGPAEIAVDPSAVFSDGGYTVAVNAIMGTQFVDPASGIDNQVFFADPNDDPDPASDLPAAGVTFVDDTRLSVLTPSIDALTKQSAVATLYNLYHTTSAYATTAKQNGGGLSNTVPFVFVDANAAAFTIDAIDPNIGPAAGGNTVQLSGEFGDLDELDPGPVEPPTPNGQQAFIGTQFVDGEPVEFAPLEITAEADGQITLTLYHNRAPNASAGGPAAVSFSVNWDPTVLAIPGPAGVQAAPLLGEWYGKQLALNFQQVTNGELAVVVSGGQTFTPDFQAVSTEITTFDNQLPELVDEAGTDQQNPFPILSITFNVLGADGTSSPVSFSNLTMADRDAVALPDQGNLNTTVVVGGGAKQGQGSELFNVAFGTQAATVQQAGEVDGDTGADRIDITAPPVDQAAAAAAFEAEENFSVDVRVESVDFDPFASDGSETLFAISRAASVYTQTKSIDGGYTYQPGPVRQIANFSPIGTWVFGAQELTIEGQGFTEGQTSDPVVTFEVVDDNSETVSLPAELVSVSDTEIVVVVPTLDAEVSGRTTEATINVAFEDGDESVDGFTYVKWNVTIGTSSPREFDGEAESGDVTTNSFFFSASEGFDAGDAGLVFDGAAELENLKQSTNPIVGEIVPPSETTGTLRIPPLPPAAMAGKTTDRVFGILRVTEVEEIFGIGPLQDDPAEGELPFPGNKFETIFNFDLHLFEGQAPYDEFYVKYDVEDLPDVPSLVYNVPASVGLTRAEIATGRVATWSRPTTFDFTFATQSASIPAVTASEKDESLMAPRPNTYSLESVLITEDTLPADADEAPTAVRARIFNLGAGSFALRRDAAPGVDDINARTSSRIDIVVSTDGGDEVSISGQNIYWATNLFAVPAGSTPAQSNPFGAPVERSVDENGVETLVFIAPALAQGTYDLYIEVPTSTGSKQTVLIPVEEGQLIVRADGKFPFPIGIIPALLGGLVALLGILAGGDSDSSGGPCFIATAAYGTPMATEIEVLRTVRDSYLLSNPLGAAFVDTYYRVSPALADVVAQSPVLASVIRLLLTPVLFAAKMLVSMPAVSFGLLGMGMLLAAMRRRFVRGM